MTTNSKLTIPLQIKALQDREFDGLGSVFGNEDLGGDIVLPGAFAKTLARYRKDGTTPPMFWMHDPTRVPGKWIELSEVEDGLHVKGVLAPTELGNEIHTLLTMDAVKGLSIGYQPTEVDFNKEGTRLLKQVELWEVSVVSLPMNPLARVAHAKSQLSEMGEYVPTPREFERTLRDVGCSLKVAKTILSKVYDGYRDEPVFDEKADDGRRDEPEKMSDDEREAAAALKVVADRILASQIRKPKLK